MTRRIDVACFVADACFTESGGTKTMLIFSYHNVIYTEDSVRIENT